ncbi:MAG: alpha-ketoacid dehydrogenase subunit beta [Deltaproteobacteria bacterium]|nr:alpha-ketoacid dehydrogenase subunit beta [Deltaproteobacteria bacterium]
MTINYRECCKLALRQCLDEEPRAFLMGEDVGAYGGCYAVSKGLLDVYGPDRIRDTPLSESAFVGVGIGAAMNGMRPIVEVMTCNFSLLALDQIINNAATLRHMSGGQLGVPLVIRMATGAGRQLAAQHSHSFEGWYAHIPGVRILAPATLEDARFMLPAALKEPDPVLLFEHVFLYAMEGELDASVRAVDIEHAALRRRGTHLSILTYGASLQKSLSAADALAAEGIDAEVIDLRVLRPLDDAALVDTVKRTHRVLVVDEGWKSGGLSAELMARVCELAFDELDAPPTRVCTAEVPIPYPKHLEDAALPQAATIAAAARRVCGRG